MTSEHNERGFTMAELLVAVAIIAVLVAIAIPVFGAQLEKSRQAVDLANVRSAYAALQISKLEGTLPDGTLPSTSGGSGSSSPVTYYYTDKGFERYDSITGTPIKLVSHGDGSYLSDFIKMPSELWNFPDPASVEGWDIVVFYPPVGLEPSLTIAYPRA